MCLLIRERCCLCFEFVCVCVWCVCVCVFTCACVGEPCPPRSLNGIYVGLAPISKIQFPTLCRWSKSNLGMSAFAVGRGRGDISFACHLPRDGDAGYDSNASSVPGFLALYVTEFLFLTISLSIPCQSLPLFVCVCLLISVNRENRGPCLSL